MLCFLLFACESKSQKNERLAEKIIYHSYTKYEKGKYGAAWKAFIETIYFLDKKNINIKPEIHLYAALLCATSKDRRNPEKSMCFDYLNKGKTEWINDTGLVKKQVSVYLEMARKGNLLSEFEFAMCRDSALFEKDTPCRINVLKIVRSYFKA